MNSSFYANKNNHFRKKIQFDLIVWTYQWSNANGITAFNGSQTLLPKHQVDERKWVSLELDSTFLTVWKRKWIWQKTQDCVYITSCFVIPLEIGPTAPLVLNYTGMWRSQILMKCNGSIVIHNVCTRHLFGSEICLFWRHSVFHRSKYLKGQPFSVSAIINLALWLHRQARHQDYNSISITHPTAPNSPLHKAETTFLSSALQSHEIKEKEIAKVFWKEANSL